MAQNYLDGPHSAVSNGHSNRPKGFRRGLAGGRITVCLVVVVPIQRQVKRLPELIEARRSAKKRGQNWVQLFGADPARQSAVGARYYPSATKPCGSRGGKFDRHLAHQIRCRLTTNGICMNWCPRSS